MQAAGCAHENAASARFCATCGAKLARRCPSCGAVVGDEARFCAACGTAVKHVDGPGPPPAAASPLDAPTPSGERRQLTVLFCDVVGSTARAARLDPEEWRAVVVDYHRVAREVIARFDGHVAKNLGDGFLAYFGWPAAHEDDAERA